MQDTQQITASPQRTFGVEWWYRHESDDDQTIRQFCQMSNAVSSTAEIDAEIASLRAQGYHVQQIKIQAICSRCQSNGRIVVRKFKRKPAKYAECPSCHGAGFVGERLDWPIQD